MTALTIQPTLARRSMADRPRSLRHVANRLTAAALALSLMLGAALPVQAKGKDDLAKALIAAIILGVIVNEFSDGHAAPRPVPAPEPVPEPKPRPKPLVPSVCAIEIGGEGRAPARRVFSERCLQQEGFTYALPQRCASEARIYGRWDRIYGAQCLREAGFRIAR